MRFDWANLKQKVIEYAYIIGINKIGFTDTEPLNEYLTVLEKRCNAGFKFALQEGDPQKRIRPVMHLADAKSIISVAVSYRAKACDVEHNPGEDSDVLRRGRLSYITRGRDYHHIVREKLEDLSAFIKKTVPQPVETILMVDTGELLEKAIAAKAGLGWMGRNTLLTIPEYGSYVSLGEIICNLPFPPDAPEIVKAKGCGQCRKCLDACPTKALDAEGNLNPDLCLASLTQTKKSIPIHLREHMGNSIYGCDICQQVCPHNHAKNKDVPSGAFNYDYPLLEELLQMSNREFSELYGHTSGAWRGRTVWQRNAIIAAGNLKAQHLIPVIKAMLLHDQRIQIRVAAAWALGKIPGPDASTALWQALDTEKERQVIDEIRQSLDI